ncbi:outer membrane scaffolding protein for murein synthesis (MipA/OmpV family) [Mesorhizobium sp. J18]|uniref:MipA/OmpV family protein n=1 Tax=Mesorhizobium sp. J18 TaxID=935263 RepID=UPI00119A6D32|nr:MipA/OmpV family protein [Mesorhizobium sp. J18]TWG99360.1 outer membrane scaffolding protein for murein synthesis (MipA/OmpV family) [Mesorhizobium sp. J18]
MARSITMSCVAGALCLCWLAQAQAADNSAEQAVYHDSIFSGGRWGVAVGGFAGFQPAYEGADEYRFVGFPLVLPKFYGESYDAPPRSRITYRGIDDIRLTALTLGGLDIGPLAGYSFGREENLAARLQGLGDVDGGMTAGGFAAYHFDPFFVDIAYNAQITGDSDTGHTWRFGLGMDHNLSERLSMSTYLNSSYASKDYMDAYFSVSPAQSANSGLGIYDAGAGFKDIGLDIGFDYRLTERVTMTTKAGYSRLLGDAADSPVTESRNQFFGGLGLTYTFGQTD